MNLTVRAEHIRDRLSRHWLIEVGAATSPMPIEDWHIAADDLGPHARFGLGWPMPWDEPQLIIPFCPELIDQVTCQLSEADLDTYLGACEFLVDVELGHIVDGLSREQAVVVAEDTLNEVGPGSLVLFTDTQLEALDRGIGC